MERSNHNHYNSLQSRWKMSLEHHFASFFLCLRLHLLSSRSIHLSIRYHFLQSNGYSRISLLLRRFSRRMNAGRKIGYEKMWWLWKWNKLMDWRKGTKKKKKSRLNDDGRVECNYWVKIFIKTYWRIPQKQHSPRSCQLRLIEWHPRSLHKDHNFQSKNPFTYSVMFSLNE